MRRRALWLVLLLGGASGAPLAAEERPAIVVTDPSARAYRAAVQRFALEGDLAHVARPEQLRQTTAAALEFSGLFDSIEPSAFLGPEVSEGPDGPAPICPNWRQIGADALIEGRMQVDGSELSVDFRVRDVARGCVSLLRKRYRGAVEDQRRVARAIADDVIGAFTGKPGVADTEIAFVSDRSGATEIYVMDADGSNLRPATKNRSINNFPSWAPDGKAIAYTSYHEGNRPYLFLLTRDGHSPGRILRDLAPGGAQYRAVFDPRGERLAVVASVEGAADIFVVPRNGGGPRRLTNHHSIDVGPTWSPDGRRLAFVSDRSGTPQLYVTDLDSGGTRRLTYDGSYNSAPAWSPDGRWIAYETRVEGQFDIWLIDPEGRTNAPLIVHPRSDETPSWAPDGRMLAFSSKRRGRADIYLVDVSGENLRRITHGDSNDTSPAWGPYRR